MKKKKKKMPLVITNKQLINRPPERLLTNHWSRAKTEIGQVAGLSYMSSTHINNIFSMAQSVTNEIFKNKPKKARILDRKRDMSKIIANNFFL